MGPDLFQDFQAVLLAEPQIEKDQARMRLFEVAAQVLPGRHGSRRHIVFLQIIGDRLPHHHVVIDYKYVAHLVGFAGHSSAPNFDS
jgi:hypothetical protein